MTKSNLLRIADNVRDAYMIGEHVQNQYGTVVYTKEDKDAIERALREAAARIRGSVHESDCGVEGHAPIEKREEYDL
jgi:hypothetical protein